MIRVRSWLADKPFSTAAKVGLMLALWWQYGWAAALVATLMTLRVETRPIAYGARVFVRVSVF